MAIYLLAKVKSGEEKKVLNRIRGIKQLVYAHLVFGDYDIIAKFKGSRENIGLISKVVNRIKGIQLSTYFYSKEISLK